MASMLLAIATAPPNNYVLRSVALEVDLGVASSGPTARAMAERVYAARSRLWSAAARQQVSTLDIIQALSPSEDMPMTNSRPGLVGALCIIMDSRNRPPPEDRLKDAMFWIRYTLQVEVQRDTATALAELNDALRMELREVAMGQVSSDRAKQLYRESAAGYLLSLLDRSDPGQPVRFQPPYGALIALWVSDSGKLLVDARGATLEFATPLRENLIFFAEHRNLVDAATRAVVSQRVLSVLADHGIGIRNEGGVGWRGPAHPAEFHGVPALAALYAELGLNSKHTSLRRALAELPTSRTDARTAVNAKDGTAAAAGDSVRFRDVIGWEVLLALRHAMSHLYWPLTTLVQEGWRPTVVNALVRDAVESAIATRPAQFARDRRGVLRLTSPPPSEATGVS